jgi:hypothetical protein
LSYILSLDFILKLTFLVKKEKRKNLQTQYKTKLRNVTVFRQNRKINFGTSCRLLRICSGVYSPTPPPPIILLRGLYKLKYPHKPLTGCLTKEISRLHPGPSQSWLAVKSTNPRHLGCRWPGATGGEGCLIALSILNPGDGGLSTASTPLMKAGFNSPSASTQGLSNGRTACK